MSTKKLPSEKRPTNVRTPYFDTEKFSQDMRAHRQKVRAIKPSDASSIFISKKLGISVRSIDLYFHHNDNIPTLHNFIILCYWMGKDPSNYFKAPEWVEEDVKHIPPHRELTIAQRRQVELYNDLAIDAATFGYANAHAGISEILRGLVKVVGNFFIDNKIPHRHEIVIPENQADTSSQEKGEVVPLYSDRKELRKHK